MRRIYESAALHRDETDPFAPADPGQTERPEAMRSVPSGLLSRLFVPHWLRYRAISVDVSTPLSTYPVGTRVPFTVTLRNRLPIPITVPVDAPVPWTWHVDGVMAASHVATVPSGASGFRFERGERKRFERQWSGRFRVAADEWEPAGPGTYTIGVRLSVSDAQAHGVTATTQVDIVPA